MKKALIIAIFLIPILFLGLFPASYHIYNYKLESARYTYWKNMNEVWCVGIYAPRECWSGYINGKEGYEFLRIMGTVLGFFSSIYFDFKYKYLIHKIDSKTIDGSQIIRDLDSVYPAHVAFLSFEKIGGDITQWQEISRGGGVTVIPWPNSQVKVK